MTRNTEMFDAVADAIERLPWSYYQGEWFYIASPESREPDQEDCGTRMCVAGWAADLAGWAPLEGEELRPGRVFPYLWKDGVERQVSAIARDALGLSNEESDQLFSAGWNPTLFSDGQVSVPEALRAIGRGADICGPYTLDAVASE